MDAGSEFLVVILPGLVDSPGNLADMNEYPFMAEHELMDTELARRGIACFDSTPRFKGHDPRRLVVNRFDRHFNENGNRLVAEALWEKLKDWAPRKSSPQGGSTGGR
jgi:hypothetical protein